MSTNRARLLGSIAVVLTVGAYDACAAVLATTGTVALTQTPYPGESDLNIFVFDEQQTVPFDAAQNLNFGTITPGTLVNSHYIQFDPIVPNGSIGTGTVTFNGPIIGLITTTSNLNDNLGANGTSDEYFGLALDLGPYPTGAPGTAQNRGLGSAQDDLIFTLGEPTLTVESLEIGAAGSLDGFRVLTARIDGDLNEDGFVGLDDLDVVLPDWNKTVPPGDPRADPSGDEFIGLDDLDVVLNDWNAGTPPPGAAVIPEPVSVILWMAGAVAFTSRGSRGR